MVARDEGVSGRTLLEALLRAGFEVRHRTSGLAIVERGYRVLVVPDVPRLAPDQLTALLSAAGVTYAALEGLLDDRAALRSGLYPRHRADDDLAD